MLNSPRRKTLLDNFSCNFSGKGEVKSFVKSFIRSIGCLYVQPAIPLVDF